MSTFLQLPEGSPAAALMAALVHTGDMLAEHGDLLSPEFAAALFRVNAVAAHVLVLGELCSCRAAGALLDDARRR